MAAGQNLYLAFEVMVINNKSLDYFIIETI
jgi:hypothetical protein